MDTLPNEMWSLILKRLSFKDLVRTSAVCKKLNVLVLHILTSIEQLQVRGENFYNKLDERSFVLFQSVNSFTVEVDNKELCNSLFEFLATHCPNLTIVNAPDTRIRLTTLEKLSKKLKYFSFATIIRDTRGLLKTSTFPNLMAFDITNENYALKNHKIFDELRNELFKQNNEFIFHFWPEINSLQLLSPNVKYLVLSNRDFITPSINFPEFASGPVEILHIRNVKLEPGTIFANLKLIKVDAGGDSGILWSVVASLRQSKCLKVLCFDGEFDENWFEELSQLLSQNVDLQFVKFEGYVETDEQLIFPLGPKLSYLQICLDLPLVLLNNSSPKLKHLNLRVLTVEPVQLNFSRLLTLDLTFTLFAIPSDIREIIYSLCTNNSLQKVSLGFPHGLEQLTEEGLLQLKDCIPVSGVKYVKVSATRLSIEFSWTFDLPDLRTNEVKHSLPKQISRGNIVLDCKYKFTTRWGTTQEFQLILLTSKKTQNVLSVTEALRELSKLLTDV